MKLPRREVEVVDWQIALSLAVGTVLFNALIQLEAYLLYLRDGGARTDVAFLLALPFLQLDAAVLGVLFGVAYLLTRARWTRWAVVAVAFLASAWAIVNQVAFGILRRNVSIFDPEIALARLMIDAPRLASSAVSAAGWLSVVNVLLLITGALWLQRRGRAAAERRLTPDIRVAPLLITAIAYVILSAQTPRLIDVRGLDRHAAVALLTHEVPGSMTRAIDPTVPDLMLRRLAFGSVIRDASDARLSEVVVLARTLQRPNVVLVVLESVGTDQLFPNGTADSTVTPHVARLARRAVLFPNIYTVCPATTFAHMPMVTGGPLITWGDASEYFSHPYTGPTLPGELGKLGYRTGLFAATDLGFSELDRLYRQMAWDTLLHFGKGNGPLLASQRITPWGVNEGHLWMHARRWVERERTPFFLDFQTISTHYPYGTPSDFHGPSAATDARSRYFNALAYTDAVLGRLLADLSSRGELDRTIVVITGDHGEAFGDRHPQNVTHRNFLYDENVRSFLLFALPGFRGPLVSSRVGSHAGLMPSLLALLGSPISISGENLFWTDFAPRPEYFYVRVPPGQWGLRDGQWKFIDRIAGGIAELYDIARDPDEQTNVAAQHADMIAAYRTMVREWYARATYEFLGHLSGVGPEEGIMTGTRLRSGLRDVRVGSLSRPDANDFKDATVLPRHARPTVNVRWLSMDRETPVRVRFVSPSRRFWVFPVTIEEPWSSTNVTPPLATDEIGRWTVDIWSGAGRLGRTVFDVR